jgi:hypothetical protein
MTISSTNRKAGPFVGNGTASVFPFTFKVFQDEDLEVVRATTASGLQSTLVLDSDYTVSLNADQDGSPGGSVTLTAGVLATGYTIIISSSIDELQETDITNNGGFYPEVITNALDLLTILVQQLQEQVNRSIKLPTTDPALQVELASAAQRAGLLLGFDSSGNAQAVVNVSTILPNYGIKVVPFSATPALNANQGSKLQITLTGNAAPTFTSGGSAAVFFSVQVIQDGVGGRTWTWPANMKNMGAVNPTPNSVSEQLCSLDANGTARGLGPMMYS